MAGRTVGEASRRKEISDFWALLVKWVSHYESLFYNNHHFNTNFHLQYVDFDTCWPTILDSPTQRQARRHELNEVQIFHTLPMSCFNTAHWSTQAFHRGPLFTLGSLQTVARVQNVDQVHTLNNFALQVWIETFPAAFGEEFTTL